MIKYIIKRLLMGILVLFGTSLLIFTIARVVPGDVATIALEPEPLRQQKKRFAWR